MTDAAHKRGGDSTPAPAALSPYSPTPLPSVSYPLGERPAGRSENAVRRAWDRQLEAALSNPAPGPRETERTPDTLPHRSCPRCGGRIYITTYHPQNSAQTIWDANCVACGATVAQWLPGHSSWMALYDNEGKRIPNPHNIAGYGLPDEDDTEEE